MTTGTTPKPTDPLSVDEVAKASDRFFPLFEEVRNRMPRGSSIEDTLKIMESVCGLAHKLRAEDANKSGPFGFNKPTEDNDQTN